VYRSVKNQGSQEVANRKNCRNVRNSGSKIAVFAGACAIEARASLRIVVRESYALVAFTRLLIFSNDRATRLSASMI
jgi:hypothetical protein